MKFYGNLRGNVYVDPRKNVEHCTRNDREELFNVYTKTIVAQRSRTIREGKIDSVLDKKIFEFRSMSRAS